MTLREALALGFAMNARGSTEVIVASIGLSMGALTQNLFTMIVAMAVTTTMAMPPLLRWGLSRVPMSRSEKQRLEREEMEARGFVPNIERLLLAVDDSPNGRFASRLAGLIAGPRGMPITVVPLGKDEAPTAAKKETPQPADRRTPGQASRRQRREERQENSVGQKAAGRRDRPQAGASGPRRRRRGGRKGLRPAADRARPHARPVGTVSIPTSSESPPISKALSRSSKPRALTANIRSKATSTLSCRSMAPQIARRGAEVAIAIARVVRAPLRAIYVSETAGRNRSGRSGMRARWHEQAILKDIVELADMADLDIKTAVRAGRPAEDAILSEVGRNADKLIVMGVARPSGELFFGEIAAAVLEKSPASILLVSS